MTSVSCVSSGDGRRGVTWDLFLCHSSINLWVVKHPASGLSGQSLQSEPPSQFITEQLRLNIFICVTLKQTGWACDVLGGDTALQKETLIQCCKPVKPGRQVSTFYRRCTCSIFLHGLWNMTMLRKKKACFLISMRNNAGNKKKTLLWEHFLWDMHSVQSVRHLSLVLVFGYYLCQRQWGVWEGCSPEQRTGEKRKEEIFSGMN